MLTVVLTGWHWNQIPELINLKRRQMFLIYGFSLQALGPVSFGLRHHSLGVGGVEEAACYHYVRDEAKKEGEGPGSSYLCQVHASKDRLPLRGPTS